MGYEEKKYIIPSIKKLKKQKIFIEGPFPADSLFTKKNIEYYDCFVCCYHDQALIPFKIFSEFSGVNFTGSLSIIRTSPDHGTGFDIAGKGKASEKSLFAALIKANEIAQKRKNWTQ